MDPALFLPTLLGFAVLAPLASFAVILCFGRWLGTNGGFIATAAIVCSFLISLGCFGIWVCHHPPEPAFHGHGGHGHTGDSHSSSSLPNATHAAGASVVGEQTHTAGHVEGASATAHGHSKSAAYSHEYWTLGQFGPLRLAIDCYIDSLTITMFCMVTLIASCIHFYAMGYMHDELHEVTDKEVTLSDGSHLKRPGRFPRFFQYLSLFCFSMLGLVLAGNIAMVFVFWELVGICSYFLIGFYIERKSASTAANKAFIVNRVGDFGMIIGLMALWSSLGTFTFGDTANLSGALRPGIFSLVRSAENEYRLGVPDGMVRLSASDEIAKIVLELPGASQAEIESKIAASLRDWRTGSNESGRNASHTKYGYWLLVIAGLGIFCGCVGKSAQFPLHVWLPDAMEGPTPVSALVHSATMVAAGVYLVGRFYPVFAPEVLLVIAVAGGITLFLAASIAITANDIKRVLAYSTVSQLGYMMLGLGVGGWLGGLLHLITHAFFKSLLFMCSGSVIHAVHTNDMREMGGLRKKMPVTAYTMLIGCLAIAGAHIFITGFSGHYSKDAILEQAWSFMQHNQSFLAAGLFWAAAGGAGITAFYMFRMWFLTFAGTPRNQERYDHAHESPKVMYIPLIILSLFAVGVAWKGLDAVIGALVAVGISLWIAIRYRESFYAQFASHADQHGHGHAHAAHGHGSHGHAQHNHQAPNQQTHSHDSHGSGHHESGHHEALSPKLIYLPLAISLVAFLVAVGTQFSSFAGNLVLENLLEGARPAGVGEGSVGEWIHLAWPAEHLSHAPAVRIPVTLLATITALSGIAFAAAMYGLGWLSADEVRRQFQPMYNLLLNKWWFDELYDFLFVRPTHVVSNLIAGFDRSWIDYLIDNLAEWTKRLSVTWDAIADRCVVDGSVNLMASWTYSIGLLLRGVQTGRLRQYVMFIVVGAIAVFVLISFFWNSSLAG